MKFFLFFTFFYYSLYAEVEKVNISWTAQLCNQRCIQQLENQFSKIKGVSNVDLKPGLAELRWKPNVPFNLSPVNVAMGLVGVSISDIRVKVRGTIRASNKDYRIVSLGDNTPFLLLSPVTPYRGTFTTPFSTANRALTPEMRQKLFDAQKTNKIVVIEGPLFMPERSPPLMLVLDQVNILENKEDSKLERR